MQPLGMLRQPPPRFLYYFLILHVPKVKAHLLLLGPTFLSVQEAGLRSWGLGAGGD